MEKLLNKEVQDQLREVFNELKENVTMVSSPVKKIVKAVRQPKAY